MKKILFLLAATAIFLGCSKDDDNGDDGASKYTQIKITENIYKYGKPFIEETFEIYTYDSNKNLIEKYSNPYYEQIEGRISETTTYKYDDQNRLIEERNGDERIEYSYNDRDLISEKKLYKESGLSKIYTYEYDDNKRIIKEIESDIWISNDYGYISEYSYNGKEVTIHVTNKEDGSFFWHTYQEYDDRGNLILEKYSNERVQDVISRKIIYEYNPDGTIKTKKISTSLVFDGSKFDVFDYTYNEDQTIHKIHISHTYKSGERERIYYYINK